MAKPVIIFGAATLSELVFEILTSQGLKVLGTTADSIPEIDSEQINFLGLFNELKLDMRKINFCVCIGDNRGRMQVMERILSMGGQLINAVHPESHISISSSLGNGNIIFPYSYIGTRVSLGDGNIVFPFVSLTHHTNVDNYAFFAPNTSVGGHSKIGSFAKFGMNSTVLAHSQVPSDTHLMPGDVFGGGA
jgi:acetyltransferase-like isoleucine patch superfamily enzyme